jgi:DNA-directed RNA polymerase subunit beta'
MQTKNLESITLSLASPEAIRKWSFGEIQKPETINYRTGRSERNGLFDERVFGPEKDYQCYCTKYRGIRYRGITCEKCGVSVIRSIVRRERMGHIELACPIAHIWMLRTMPSRMSLLLDVKVSLLEKVVYFASYIVISVDELERENITRDLEREYKAKKKTITNSEELSGLDEMYLKTKAEIQSITYTKVLTELEYHTLSRKYPTLFHAGIGAEALYEICQNLDIEKLYGELSGEKTKAKGDKLKREKAEKRLVLVKQFLVTESKPEWMFVTVLPIIPPGLRPMVGLEAGRYATSDINDLYRRIINRNNRLKKLKEIGAPEVILRNEKRILQEAVDALIDNSMSKASGNVAMSTSQKRQLKSLADTLKSKRGLLRSNMLGKRVDYTGRSVIVVGPKLKISECGIPKHMALELFRPFVMSELIARDLAFNVRGANRLIEDGIPEVWEVLEQVSQGKKVLLNRAPSLHRLSIQAFSPVLIEGKAIQLHPLVCSAFNADFDGDQMAVHLPLSAEAQRESRELMASNKNLLKPQNGDPIVLPRLDMVLGIYWLTKIVEGTKGEGMAFSSPTEAQTILDYGNVDVHAKIMVLPNDEQKYESYEGKPFETTVGRLIFNNAFPSDYPFINKAVKGKDLREIIEMVITKYGIDGTPVILDAIKDLGNEYATYSGSTYSMGEAQVPKGKAAIITEGKRKGAEIKEQYMEGLISDSERYMMTIDMWENVKNQIVELLKKDIPNSKSMSDMMESGARSDINSYTQVAGMKGIIINATGRALEYPILSSYKEGYTPLDYFFNTTTARKGLADTALKTAKAGYLTRRLHDIAQELVITEIDCGTTEFDIATKENFDGLERKLTQNIFGRITAKDIEKDGIIICKKAQMITREMAQTIENAGITEVEIRTPLKCKTRFGICQQCYGYDLGRAHLVKLGEPVGTIAAQAIGEPGTQLTLRTFHLGGVIGRDITQGLPRVEELLESRSIKVPAVIAKENGMITDIEKTEKGYVVHALHTDDQGTQTSGTYQVDPRRTLLFKKQEEFKKGELLTDGSAQTKDLLEVAGKEITQKYIIKEVNKVYEMQGAGLDKRHLEIMVRQMMSRCKITDGGDSLYTRGQIVEIDIIREQNENLAKEDKKEATYNQMVMGVKEARLASHSWLASASFEQTSRSLVEAALGSRKDPLRGLKENILIGNLIPAGTGLNPNFIDMSDVTAEREAFEEKSREEREEKKQETTVVVKERDYFSN